MVGSIAFQNTFSNKSIRVHWKYWLLFLASFCSTIFYLHTVTIVIFLSIVLLLSLKKPVFSICAVMCCLLSKSYYGEYKVVLPFLLFVTFFILLKNFKRLSFLKPFDLIFVATFVYCLIISILNNYSDIIQLIAMIAFVIIVRLLIFAKIVNLQSVIVSVTIAVIMSGIIGLRQNAFGLSFGEGSVNRFNTAYGDPNFYCLVGTGCIIGMLGFKKCVFKYVSILLILTFCCLTFSKSFFVLVFVNIVYLFFSSKIKISAKLRLFFVVGLAFAFICWILNTFFSINIIQSFAYRFLREEGGNLDINSLTTGRTNIQIAFFEYFLHSQSLVNVLLGSGYIGTEKIAPLIGLTVETTHMYYLQILMDFGVVGFSALMLLFVKGFIGANKTQRQILFTYFIGIFFLSWPLSAPYFLFYFVLNNKESIHYNEKKFRFVSNY